MNTSRDILIALVIKYKGKWDGIMTAVSLREHPEDEFLQKVEMLKCRTVTLIDPEYPAALRHIVKPPFVLFYYGDLNLISNYYKNISVVGSRDCSKYGSSLTTEIAGDLAAKGYTIVSGMARGIDSIAHHAAIDRGGKTVAVLGCGIDYCYPVANAKLYEEIKKNHLLISEYPGNDEPEPSNFPIRNRIIAGLSKTLIVTEAKYQSGSMTTALLALNGNSDVMCLPYPAGQRSECNRLISNGAILIENADDVLKEMSRY